MKKVIKYEASDWRKFDKEEDCKEYEAMLIKVKFYLGCIEREIIANGYAVDAPSRYDSFQSLVLSEISRADKVAKGKGFFKKAREFFNGPAGCNFYLPNGEEDNTPEAIAALTAINDLCDNSGGGNE